MNSPPNPAIIGICNDILDEVHMLEFLLEEAGYKTVSFLSSKEQLNHTERKQYVKQWIMQNDPQIVIYNVTPPYESQWKTFKKIRESEEAKGCRFIVTTTHSGNLKEYREDLEEPVRIINSPFNIDDLLFGIECELTSMREPREGKPFKEGRF